MKCSDATGSYQAKALGEEIARIWNEFSEKQ